MNNEELAAVRAAIEVLDDVQGDINPERGYCEELEADISRVLKGLREIVPGPGVQTWIDGD